MSEDLVRNVSDTARWVAWYRAQESARHDALFHDPLAGRLAGERGRAIAERASKHSAWALVTRTQVIDDYVTAAVRSGTGRVLNLAAGFDTRPYRLPLPPELSWVEADLPALLAEKNELLAGERAHCQLERVAVDLADDAARAEFLAARTAGKKDVTVITEGLVIYLDERIVTGLSHALSACAPVKSWILDFNSPRIQAEMLRSMQQMLSNAPFKFAPANGLAFFENLGWRVREVRSLFREGARLRRVPLLMRPFALLPDPNPRHPGNGRWSGVVWLERA